MMNYGQLLSQSWKIVRRHKFLWLLGMMAGLLTFASSLNTTYPDMGLRVGSGYPFEVSPFGRPSLEQLPPETLEEFERNYERFAQDLSQIQPILVTGSVVNLLVAFLLWVIHLAARAGLIYAAAALDQGESMAFGTAFRRGLGKVGRLIGLKIVLTFAPFILFVLMFIVMSIVMAISQAFEISPVLGILFMTIIVIIWLIVGIALFMAGIAWPFVDAFAFRAVWRENESESLTLGLIFVPFYIAINIAIWLLFAPFVFSMGFLKIVVFLLLAVYVQSVFVPSYLVAVAFQFTPFLSHSNRRPSPSPICSCLVKGGLEGGLKRIHPAWSTSVAPLTTRASNKAKGKKSHMPRYDPTILQRVMSRTKLIILLYFWSLYTKI